MDLLIVAKDRPMLYDAFRRMSVGDADIEIVVDRRNGATRAPASAVDRRGLNIYDALKTTGWAVVPSRARRNARTDAA